MCFVLLNGNLPGKMLTENYSAVMLQSNIVAVLDLIEARFSFVLG